MVRLSIQRNALSQDLRAASLRVARTSLTSWEADQPALRHREQRRAQRSTMHYRGRSANKLWARLRIIFRLRHGLMKGASASAFARGNISVARSAWRSCVETEACLLRPLIVSAVELRDPERHALRQRRMELEKRVARHDAVSGLQHRSDASWIGVAAALLHDVAVGVDDVCLPREHHDDVTALCLLSTTPSASARDMHSSSASRGVHHARTARAVAGVAAARAAAAGLCVARSSPAASTVHRRHYLASGGGAQDGLIRIWRLCYIVRSSSGSSAAAATAASGAATAAGRSTKNQSPGYDYRLHGVPLRTLRSENGAIVALCDLGNGLLASSHASVELRSGSAQGPVVIVWRWRTAERVREFLMPSTALALAPLTRSALLGSLAPTVERERIEVPVAWPRAVLLGARDAATPRHSPRGAAAPRDAGSAACAGRYTHCAAYPFIGRAPVYVRGDGVGDADGDGDADADERPRVRRMLFRCAVARAAHAGGDDGHFDGEHTEGLLVPALNYARAPEVWCCCAVEDYDRVIQWLRHAQERGAQREAAAARGADKLNRSAAFAALLSSVGAPPMQSTRHATLFGVCKPAPFASGAASSVRGTFGWASFDAWHAFAPGTGIFPDAESGGAATPTPTPPQTPLRAAVHATPLASVAMAAHAIASPTHVNPSAVAAVVDSARLEGMKGALRSALREGMTQLAANVSPPKSPDEVGAHRTALRAAIAKKMTQTKHAMSVGHGYHRKRLGALTRGHFGEGRHRAHLTRALKGIVVRTTQAAHALEEGRALDAVVGAATRLDGGGAVPSSVSSASSSPSSSSSEEDEAAATAGRRRVTVGRAKARTMGGSVVVSAIAQAQLHVRLVALQAHDGRWVVLRRARVGVHNAVYKRVALHASTNAADATLFRIIVLPDPQRRGALALQAPEPLGDFLSCHHDDADAARHGDHPRLRPFVRSWERFFFVPLGVDVPADRIDGDERKSVPPAADARVAAGGAADAARGAPTGASTPVAGGVADAPWGSAGGSAGAQWSHIALRSTHGSYLSAARAPPPRSPTTSTSARRTAGDGGLSEASAFAFASTRAVGVEQRFRAVYIDPARPAEFDSFHARARGDAAFSTSPRLVTTLRAHKIALRKSAHTASNTAHSAHSARRTSVAALAHLGRSAAQRIGGSSAQQLLSPWSHAVRPRKGVIRGLDARGVARGFPPTFADVAGITSHAGLGAGSHIGGGVGDAHAAKLVLTQHVAVFPKSVAVDVAVAPAPRCRLFEEAAVVWPNAVRIAFAAAAGTLSIGASGSQSPAAATGRARARGTFRAGRTPSPLRRLPTGDGQTPLSGGAHRPAYHAAHRPAHNPAHRTRRPSFNMFTDADAAQLFADRAVGHSALSSWRDLGGVYRRSIVHGTVLGAPVYCLDLDTTDPTVSGGKPGDAFQDMSDRRSYTEVLLSRAYVRVPVGEGGSRSEGAPDATRRVVRWAIAPQRTATERKQRTPTGAWLRARPIAPSAAELARRAEGAAAPRAQYVTLAENHRYDETLLNVQWECRAFSPGGGYTLAPRAAIVASACVEEGYCSGALPVERKRIHHDAGTLNIRSAAAGARGRGGGGGEPTRRSSGVPIGLISPTSTKTMLGGGALDGSSAAAFASPTTPRGAAGGARAGTPDSTQVAAARGAFLGGSSDSTESWTTPSLSTSAAGSGDGTPAAAGAKGEEGVEVASAKAKAKAESTAKASKRAEMLLHFGHDDANNGGESLWPNTISISAQHGDGVGLCEGQGDGWGKHSWHLAALGVFSRWDTLAHVALPTAASDAAASIFAQLRGEASASVAKAAAVQRRRRAAAARSVGSGVQSEHKILSMALASASAGADESESGALLYWRNLRPGARFTELRGGGSAGANAKPALHLSTIDGLYPGQELVDAFLFVSKGRWCIHAFARGMPRMRARAALDASPLAARLRAASAGRSRASPAVGAKDGAASFAAAGSAAAAKRVQQYELGPRLEIARLARHRAKAPTLMALGRVKRVLLEIPHAWFSRVGGVAMSDIVDMLRSKFGHVGGGEGGGDGARRGGGAAGARERAAALHDRHKVSTYHVVLNGHLLPPSYTLRLDDKGAAEFVGHDSSGRANHHVKAGAGYATGVAKTSVRHGVTHVVGDVSSESQMHKKIAMKSVAARRMALDEAALYDPTDSEEPNVALQVSCRALLRGALARVLARTAVTARCALTPALAF